MKQKAIALLEASREFNNLLGELSGPIYAPFFEQYQDNFQNRDGFVSQLAVFYSPDPIGHNHIIDRAPYANPEAIIESYAGAVERGWLVETSPGAYEPSDNAREFFKGIYEVDDQVFVQLKDNYSSNLTALLKFFTALVEAIKKTDVVDKKDTFDQAMQFRSAVVYIDDLQDLRDRLQEFQSFRDDVHIAAWRPHNFEGYVWEAFSDVWQDEAHTAAEILEKHPAREYEEKDYQNALTELKDRGWVSEKDGAYEITDEGKAVRQKAEDLTDEYFKAVFADLNEQEVEQTIEQLKQLKEELQAEVEPQA